MTPTMSVNLSGMPVFMYQYTWSHVKVSQAKKGPKYKELRSLGCGTPGALGESVWLETDGWFYLGFEN